MVNIVILVLVGGALGSLMRELLMQTVPHPTDRFPLDIFVANLAASFLLGLVAALHRRKVLSDSVNTLAGTGIMGGLSTFSSFVYGAVVLMQASTASTAIAIGYAVVSVVLGYLAVVLGLRLGGLGVANERAGGEGRPLGTTSHVILQRSSSSALGQTIEPRSGER